MTAPLETHTISVDQAVAVYEQAVQALHLPDGKKKYSDEEHNRRQEEALAKVQSVVEVAREVAQEAQAQAERDAEAASSDPSAWLTASELATANSRALFIAEDAKRLRRCLSLPGAASRCWRARTRSRSSSMPATSVSVSRRCLRQMNRPCGRAVSLVATRVARRVRA